MNKKLNDIIKMNQDLLFKSSNYRVIIKYKE